MTSKKSRTSNSGLLSESNIKTLSATDAVSGPLIQPFVSENIDSTSYRLRIGHVYSHKDKFIKTSLKFDRKDSWTLKPGHMAVIVTMEKIHITDNMIGIVFGTNTCMRKGLLIVNPGIITSGHSKQITFFVLNLSKTNIVLTEGEDIARITFLQTGDEKANPHNMHGDAHLAASTVARENLYQDLGGFFDTLIKPKLNKYIMLIVANVLVGGLFLAMVPILSPIISERFASVPKLRNEITHLEKRLKALESQILPSTHTSNSERAKELSEADTQSECDHDFEQQVTDILEGSANDN